MLYGIHVCAQVQPTYCMYLYHNVLHATQLLFSYNKSFACYFRWMSWESEFVCLLLEVYMDAAHWAHKSWPGKKTI